MTKMKLLAILLALETTFVSAYDIRDLESLNLKLGSLWDAGQGPKKHAPPSRDLTLTQPLSKNLRVNLSVSILNPRPELRPSVLIPSANTKKDEWKKDWLLHVLAGTHVALQAADVATTYIALDRGAKEANPLMRKIVENPPLAIAFKAAVTSGVIWVAYGSRRDGFKLLPKIALATLNGLYTTIVINNLLVINRLSR